MRNKALLLTGLLFLLGFVLWAQRIRPLQTPVPQPPSHQPKHNLPDANPVAPPWDRIIEGARRQIGVTLAYDPAYSQMTYPGGDVPLSRGVCTDVIIRAYRHTGIDLQVLVHDDISQHWAEYPKIWGLSHPDSNIDHRRVPNLETFFKRHGAVLPTSTQASDYLPGDIVTWRLWGGQPHIGLVSALNTVIHNIGGGAREESVLFAYRLLGHFRYAGSARVNTVRR